MYISVYSNDSFSFNKLRKDCLNTEFFWSVFSRIWTEYTDLRSYRKIRTRKTPFLDTFHAVVSFIVKFN